MNREYVMLASTLKEITEIPKNYLWSIKYDGMRALWLPTTRGLPVWRVPFSADPKSDRNCTGLFSRYGKVIHAPDSFLDAMPVYPVDGELWCGRNSFQKVISACRAHHGNWTGVEFRVFDAPRYIDVFTDGRINNSIVKEKRIVSADNRHLFGGNLCDRSLTIEETYKLLLRESMGLPIKIVAQNLWTRSEVLEELEIELNLGGEGLIGRDRNSEWVPKRSKFVIKLKPYEDDEATIIDYVPGKGKYEGVLGAYTVRWKNKQFDLSGMNDADRERPLARGTMVTFRYRTLTDAGFPKEARFLREYTPEVLHE